MTEHVPNIGEQGARRRRRGGYIWLFLSAIFFTGLELGGAARWYRIALVVPIALSAIGFLQASEKT